MHRLHSATPGRALHAAGDGIEGAQFSEQGAGACRRAGVCAMMPLKLESRLQPVFAFPVKGRPAEAGTPIRKCIACTPPPQGVRFTPRVMESKARNLASRGRVLADVPACAR